MTEQEVSQEELLAGMKEDGIDIGDVDARTSTQIAAGKGILKCTNAFINRSRKKGRLQLTAVCEVTAHESGDEFIGETYHKNWGLKSKENLEWFKGDLANLEIDAPKDNPDILRVIGDLTGISFEVTFVDNEGYPPNCFINAGARQNALSNSEGSGSQSEAGF